MKSGIYKIINIINNLFYIGSAIDIKKRILRHSFDLKRGIHANSHLQRAWDKYGKENFIFEVVEYCEPNKLLEREQFWIDFEEVCKKGYNIQPFVGSNKGLAMSEETKEKIRSKLINNKNCLGHKHTEETKAKIGDIHRGKKQTIEHINKLRETRKNREVSHETRQKISNAHKGRIFSEETRQKISSALKGRELSEEQKERVRSMLKSIERKPLSEETKEKISIANKGKKRTEEQIQKMKLSHKPISEEARKKMRDSHIGCIPWNKGKKIKISNKVEM